VGKSSIIRRYGSAEFPESINSTIGVDFIVKNTSIDGYTAKLQIVIKTQWDTAGQERFRTIITGYYRGADAVIFVFDKTKRETFASIEDWVQEVGQYASDKSLKVLVGNKADSDVIVSDEEAHAKASKLGYVYFNLSAKSGLGVNDLFSTVARKLIEKNKHLNIVSLNEGVKLNSSGGSSKGWCC
jgi:small GTP-binding protein